jgi:hypothetical protein
MQVAGTRPGLICTALATVIFGYPVIAASLDFQEKCANRARHVLVQLREDGEATYSNRNHYSDQMQKCFIWVGSYSATDKIINWRESILDAFEGTSYGEFRFFNDLTKKSKQAPLPIMCYVDLPEGTERCNSYHDFVRLIGVYLEMP